MAFFNGASTVTVIVTAPEGKTALVTLESVKSLLAISNDEQDPALTILISQASSLLVRRLGRPLALQGYAERLRIHRHGQGINLSNGPIVSIQSITVEGQPWAGPLDEMDVSRNLARICAPGLACWRGWPARHYPHEVTVSYTAGYLVPGMDDPGTASGMLPGKPLPLPDDIAGACLSTVCSLYHSAGRDQAIKSEAEQGVGNTVYQALDPLAGSIPPDALAVIDNLPLASDGPI